MTGLSVAELARRAGVAEASLRRWNDAGLIPRAQNGWDESDLAHVRMLAGLEERGHTLAELREGLERGALVAPALGGDIDPSPAAETVCLVRDAGRELELEPELLRRAMKALGLPATRQRLTALELQLLRYWAQALKAGVPLIAALQLARVYSQAMRQVSDAEVRLVHLFVHQPMIRDGIAGEEIAASLDELAQRLLPNSVPMMDLLHQRFVQHYIEQDAVGTMNQPLDAPPVAGQMNVAVAFADLAGFTRLTEQEGDLEAVSMVERFFEQVIESLPAGARVIKTIGDEVMIIGADPAALLEWAVAFQDERDERPLPRIGVHFGPAIYREGDYYGREINRAARIVTHGAGGEVLICEDLLDDVGRAGLGVRDIGEIRLKGFAEPDTLYVVARARSA